MALLSAGLLILGGLGLAFALNARSGASGSSQAYESAIPVAVDYPAPKLSLTDLQGKPASLEDYLGQVILVNNWAFWCTPCREELPILQDFYEYHRSQNFSIIGIEAGDDADDVEYHVKLYGLTFPIWLDPDQKALLAFHNSGLPNSYVIDDSGQVRLAWTGPISRDTLEEYVTPILEE